MPATDPAEIASGPASSIGDHMTACAKAYDELIAAGRAQIEAQNKAPAEAMNRPVPSGVIVIRLTGTSGLPFGGDCYFSNRVGSISKSYDGAIPFQTTVEGVDRVSCSFTKHSTRGVLKLEIIKDGNVIGESDTNASLGGVSVSRDVN